MNSNLIRGLKRASPIILSCISVAGVIGTAILCVRATPRAVRLIHEDSRASHDGDQYSYTKLEAIRSCWKCYIPAALTGFSTIACIVGSTCMSRYNQASIASAYGLLNQAFQRYRNAANEIFGEDADQKINAQVAKDVYVHGVGMFSDVNIYSREMDPYAEEILFFDMLSNRYFHATLAAVINAEYHVNRNIALNGEVPVNEFYEFLGIDKIKDGDNIGWESCYLYENEMYWLDFDNSRTKLEDSMECQIISVSLDPRPFE